MDQSFLSGFEVDPHHLDNKQKEIKNWWERERLIPHVGK